MTDGSFQNHTEEFVFHLCRETFLSLWSYANPKRDQGKELCDVLVVCEPDVVVISVKDAELNLDATPEVAVQRWLRSAVEKSVKQVYGADRWLQKHGDRVIRHDGSEGLPLPPLESRRTHRVSVSLGSNGLVPLRSGNYGKGFVHVLDEQSFLLLMDSLDTVTDFVDYLAAKEDLVARRPGLTVAGEENLLAIYLHRGRTFPELLEGPVPDGLWNELISNPAYQRRLEEDEVSYIWDRLLEYFGRHALAGTFEFGNELMENEVIFREMGRESRFGRRLLGDALKTFLDRAKAGELRARMCKSIRGTGYLFMNARPDATRENRRMELEMRSFVARGELDCDTVIGICVNVKEAPQGYCEDVLMLRLPEWTPEYTEQAEKIKSDLGFFAKPLVSKDHVEEYPSD